jgi:catechol 2,3-dioxygenase-like lactoylglutathione lyase family enzyme
VFNHISNLLGHYETGQLSRRDLLVGLTALAAAPQTSAQSSSALKGTEINHIAINVPDVQRSRDFYQEVLDLPVLDESRNSSFLGLGEGNFLSIFRGSPGLNHYCIGIENYEVDRVMNELTRQGLQPRRTAGTDRVYFDDPDGIEVQLAAAGHQDVQV